MRRRSAILLLACCAVLAPSLAAETALAASSSRTPVMQVAESAPVGDGEDDAPPIVGPGAQVTFLAFLIVMLVVPWLMALGPRERHAATGRADVARATARSRFTSDKERRLWLWTVAVLAAIYATLSPAAELAAALRERNLLRITSTAVLLLVVAVVAVPWVKRRPGRREVGAAIAITAVYLVTLIRIPVPEARSHLFEYGVVAVLVYHALAERRRNGRRVPVPALIAVVATALLGWLDEVIQAFLPNRAYDFVDVGFNALAGFMAVTASLLMAWARRWDVLARIRRLTGS